MMSREMKKNNTKDNSAALELLVLQDAVSELRAAESNYNNSYNSYQEDVYFFEMQAAKARITLITNEKKMNLNRNV
jgi:hypothetical protein